MGNRFSQVQWKFLSLLWMLSQPPLDACVACVSMSAYLHVHLPILSLTFVCSISIRALWLISFLSMVFSTISVCTKDAPFKLPTYISVRNIQIPLSKCPLNISSSGSIYWIRNRILASSLGKFYPHGSLGSTALITSILPILGILFLFPNNINTRPQTPPESPQE